jgi:phosphoglycerol transferase MdoB-like AlkP superfamily enzyme
MHRALIRRFVAAWVIALLSLSLTRLIFFANNVSSFRGEGTDVLWAFVTGIRFDAVSTAYMLLPFVLLLPVHSRIRNLQRWWFLAAVGAMNMLNCIDAEFFRFTSRRSTDDLFQFAFLSKDIFLIGPDLVRDFWYLIALWLVLMLLVLFLYNRTVHPTFQWEKEQEGKLASTAIMVLFGLVTVVAMRGGMQRIPIGIIDAGRGGQPHFSVLELNTSFTILKTLGKPDLLEKVYFPEGENPVSPVQQPVGEWHGRLRGHNVVVLIMESFGSEYVGALNGKGHTYTPFLDSLCAEGLLMTNAHANGHRSIEGVPACLAALPTLMYEPFITSRYAQNRFESLPSLLKEMGYSSAFLHGGENGTMGLESFAYQAGFDRYIGRREYPHEGHHDGHWGIFDHHFLNYSVEFFSGIKKPFAAGMFSLSSHHPYTVPKEMKGLFPQGNLPIHESIGYADWSLRNFFEAARKTDWFDSTLFVITADHTSLSEYPEFQTTLGSLRIPILFYHPHDTLLKGRWDTVIQQVDIMPSVLSLLGYGKLFFSLGFNVFNGNDPHMAVAFKFDRYQMLHGGMLLTFDGEQVMALHDLATDPMAHNDAKEGRLDETALQERLMKGYLQNYTRALIHNRMTLEAWQE